MFRSGEVFTVRERERERKKQTINESYSYQGDKFNSRFDARSYVVVTKLMDTHDVGRKRGE